MADGPTIRLTPVFKVAFVTVVLLTLGFVAVDVSMVVFEVDTEAAKGLRADASAAWKLGFGAIVGLIGGKAT